MSARKQKRPYTVTVELTQTAIPVYATDEDDAAFRAWNMLGVAGLKAFGAITVTEGQESNLARVQDKG